MAQTDGGLRLLSSGTALQLSKADGRAALHTPRGPAFRRRRCPPPHAAQRPRSACALAHSAPSPRTGSVLSSKTAPVPPACPHRLGSPHPTPELIPEPSFRSPDGSSVPRPLCSPQAHSPSSGPGQKPENHADAVLSLASQARSVTTGCSVVSRLSPVCTLLISAALDKAPHCWPGPLRWRQGLPASDPRAHPSSVVRVIILWHLSL